MVHVLAHRGPDGQGLHTPTAPTETPVVVLGHTRLAILDVTDAGAQPMGSSPQPDGVWITYNGEAYNFRDLRSELERCGAEFRTRTDTEVLLCAYRTWGI